MFKLLWLDQKILGLIILFSVGVFCVYPTPTLHICSFIYVFDGGVVSIFFLSYMGLIMGI